MGVSGPCCTIQTFPPLPFLGTSLYPYPPCRSGPLQGAPSFSFKPLSVSLQLGRGFCPLKGKREIGEFRLPCSDPLEVFRCRPRCLAHSSLHCCQLPVSCQRRPPELYSHPQSPGCGLPWSMRNPRADKRGALSEVLNFATPSAGRGKRWVAGRAHQLIPPFHFKVSGNVVTLYFPMLLEKVGFDLRSLFLFYSKRKQVLDFFFLSSLLPLYL